MTPSPSPDRQRSAVVVVAHADDETLGCGATVAKLVDQGWSVGVVIVSDAVVTARGVPQDHRKYVVGACRVLGTSEPTFLDFPDQALDAYTILELSSAIVDLDLHPDLVFTHADTDLNVDHRQVSQAVRVVWRSAPRPVSILEVEVPGSSFWNGAPFAANYFVDVTEWLPRKLEAYAVYDEEVRLPPHPRSMAGVEVLAQYHGHNNAMTAAEAFRLVRGFEHQLP